MSDIWHTHSRRCNLRAAIIAAFERVAYALDNDPYDEYKALELPFPTIDFTALKLRTCSRVVLFPPLALCAPKTLVVII